MEISSAMIIGNKTTSLYDPMQRGNNLDEEATRLHNLEDGKNKLLI